ncbi:MAG: DNA-directed RNA polymerase subunit omega [Hyphomonadaceae bacterium]|nr:DNA-directed RNA polymerase subunit omega [Clostridia bacterium]
MLYPSINKLMKKVDSRYTLVVMTAKRARQLAAGEEQLVRDYSEKYVSIAVKEINEGKITYHKNDPNQMN